MIIDYLFYRIYEQQYGQVGECTRSCFSASLLLSLIFYIGFYDILMLFRIIFPIKVISNTPIGKIVALGMLFLFQYLIYHHYKPKVEELQEKYKNHIANKWFKVWMLFPLIVLMVFFPFLVDDLIIAML